MTTLPPHSSIDTSPEATQIQTRPPVSQSQITVSTKTERLRYHLRLQLAGIVDQTNAISGRNAGSGWKFVPPCLISTTSGALSPHVFHRSLEKIHCDDTLYPHLEEEEALQVLTPESDGGEEQSCHTTILNSTPLKDREYYCRTAHGRHDSQTKPKVVEIVPESKASRRFRETKMQYGTIRPPSYLSGTDAWLGSPQSYQRFRNRGRLGFSRWSFFQEWHYDASQSAEDSGPLLPPTSMSWDYPVTDSPFRDFESEDQERLLVVGSYFAVLSLILLSFWVLTHHNHLH